MGQPGKQCLSRAYLTCLPDTGPYDPLTMLVPTLIRFPLWFLCWFQVSMPRKDNPHQLLQLFFFFSFLLWLIGFRAKNEVRVQQRGKMSVSLTVMTFNLLEDLPDDSPNSWEKRKDLCVTVITSYSPMILCTQQGVLVCVKLYINCVWILKKRLCLITDYGFLERVIWILH